MSFSTNALVMPRILHHLSSRTLSCMQTSTSMHSLLTNTGLDQRVSASASTMSTMTKPCPPPERLLKSMNFPTKLLMGPGPSNCPPRILTAASLPLLGHLHPEFLNIMDDVKEGIKYMFQTTNEWTFAISASGHAAMEASVANLLEPGEVALIGQNGLWGQRFADMVERNGSIAKTLNKPMGQVFYLDELEQAIKETKPTLLFLTFGESSGGTAQPLEGIGELCHKHNCLLVVDSVAALGGVPLFMDDLGIDLLYTGSQKVLSAPPGISPISFSQRARTKVEQRKTKVRSYYFDAVELANYWGCDEKPRRYHHTGLISGVYAIREGLAILAEKGLEKSWQEQKACSELLYKGLEKLNVEPLVSDKSIRNPCVTPIKVPEGLDWKSVIDYAMNNHRVEISGGLGDLAGKVWRIGIMGHNCTPEKVELVLKAFGEGLEMARK